MFKRLAWKLIKPAVVDWLTHRALVLPAAKAAEIAKRMGTTPEAVDSIEAAIAAQVLAEVERFKP